MPDIQGQSSLDDSSSHIADLLRKIYIEMKLANYILAETQGFKEDQDQIRIGFLNEMSLGASQLDDLTT